MTCSTCKGSGMIGHGRHIDACPACTSEAEMEYQDAIVGLVRAGADLFDKQSHENVRKACVAYKKLMRTDKPDMGVRHG